MLSPSTANGRMPSSVRAPAKAPSQYGGRRIYVLAGRHSYNGFTLIPCPALRLNIGSYTLRKCSGLTLRATTASISASLGHRSLSVTGTPSASMPNTSFSISKRTVPAMA